MLSPKARTELTNIVVYIVMPCNIFSAFKKEITPDLLWQSMIALLCALGMQLLVYLLNKVIYMRIPQDRQIILKYATITNNAAFMGFPIIGAVFGTTAVIYASVFLIPTRIVMWTMGLSLFTRLEKKKRIITLVTHPCIWSVFLGFAYIFAPFELPGFLSGAISAVGDMAHVLPMLIVGSILCGVKARDVLDIHCFYYSFIRLAAIPAIMFGALTLLGVDPLLTSVAVLLSAMPMALTSALLAEKYGHDALFTSKLIFVSTMLSFVTLPVITEVLTRLQR